MSTLKTNNVQIGQSSTPTHNFVVSVPVVPDGTMKIARGNAGATTQDIISVDSAGVVSFGIGVGGSVVGLTTTQTLTNKTIEAGTFTNGYTEETVIANTGTAYTIDLTNGSLQILTLTGNCTYTFPTAVAGKSFTLLQKQDATGGRTVTWPASVKWPSGTAPTITSTANKADKFVFTSDGTSWYGSVAGLNY